jgi:hypothetical protein
MEQSASDMDRTTSDGGGLKDWAVIVKTCAGPKAVTGYSSPWVGGGVGWEEEEEEEEVKWRWG